MSELSFDILNYFTPQMIAENWNEDPSNRENYLLQNYFTPWKKKGLRLSWLKGSRGIPVSLMPTAFDAQMTFRGREGFSLTETEMPFFREGYKIKEMDRQELMDIQNSTQANLNPVIDRLFDDYNQLIEGARVVKEREAAQLLFPINGNSGISFKANNVDYTYNYDASGEWKQKNYTALTGTSVWTAKTTANPFKDVEDAKDAVYDATGTEPNIMVMNNTTFNLLIGTDAVINRFHTFNPTVVNPILTKAEMLDIIERTLNVRLVVYNKKYRDESKVSHAFVPDNYVALIPDGAPLGRMAHGTTPEEVDAQRSVNADSVAIVDTGIAISQIIEPHPVNINTFASMIVLPTFERMDECALIKVA